MGPVTLFFDLFYIQTGMQVASKVGNLPSEFGDARPLGSWVIRYVRDRWTDGQTDAVTHGQKQRLLLPSLQVGGILSQYGRKFFYH